MNSVIHWNEKALGSHVFHILFYNKILYITTRLKTLGLCLEFRRVPYQWNLYCFRVFTEASLHHFAPSEVCLSWKSFLLYLSQEASDCLSPRVILRKCQPRTISSTLHLGNLQSFSSLPSSLKLPSLGIHFLEILLWWSCLAIHVIFEKEKSIPWELSKYKLA